MRDNPVRPIVFNVITIAVLLIALAQFVIIVPVRTMPVATEASHLLRELAQENDAVDETLSVGLAADQLRRQWLSNGIIVTMTIAIVANVIANYLGRGRQRTNLDRIRQLEAELQKARSASGRSQGGVK